MYPNPNMNMPYPGQMPPQNFPQGGMYPQGGGNYYGQEKMEQLERKVARLERQMERLEMRVRKLEGGYPVPLSTGREGQTESNHYMM